MTNLAWSYVNTGKPNDAIPVYEEILELSKTKLGTDHPNTVTFLVNLAFGLKAAGKLDRALAVYEEALDFRRTRLGPDHPETLKCMDDLALCYLAAGRPGQPAMPLREKALDPEGSGRGLITPIPSLFMNNLAIEYEAAGELERALAPEGRDPRAYEGRIRHRPSQHDYQHEQPGSHLSDRGKAEPGPPAVPESCGRSRAWPSSTRTPTPSSTT